MSQVTEEVTRTIESASSENLPVQASEGNAIPAQGAGNKNSSEPETEEEFLALASNKVELDLEDAPFLSKEPEVSEEAKSSKSVGNDGLDDEDLENQANLFSRKKKIILISAGVALLLLIGLGVIFVPTLLEDDAILQNVIVVPSADVQKGPAVHQLKLEPFLVQCIDGSNKIHFLEATFVLSTANREVFHEISNNQKVLRDTIYYFLEIQSSAFLLDTTNQEKLKKELLNALDDTIVSGPLDDLYIDNYLIR